jgi:hypothetical protein
LQRPVGHLSRLLPPPSTSAQSGRPKLYTNGLERSSGTADHPCRPYVRYRPFRACQYARYDPDQTKRRAQPVHDRNSEQPIEDEIDVGNTTNQGACPFIGDNVTPSGVIALEEDTVTISQNQTKGQSIHFYATITTILSNSTRP